MDDNVWFVIFEKARYAQSGVEFCYIQTSLKPTLQTWENITEMIKMDKHACFILGELFLISCVLHLAKK